jgi:hypothetical protein
MTTSTLDSHTEPTAIAVPNFREDERVLARYDAMIERRKKTFATEHVASIRRNASTKRDDLRAELDAAQAELERAQALADAAREAYRAAFPHHVKRTRLVEPTGMENLKSLGTASKLYHAAHQSWLAAEHAASTIRRIEHNETQLDVELEKALANAPQIIADVIASEKWLAEIHHEEELAAVRIKVDLIESERESYAKRLEAGIVPADELRLRAFARDDVKHAERTMTSVVFLRVERFAPAAYFIVRDARKTLFALPYDRRLETILDGVYDVVQNGDELVVRPSVRESSRMPFTLAEHFAACTPDADAAAAEQLAHRRFVSENRLLATMAERDDIEAAVLEAFAVYATDRAA